MNKNELLTGIAIVLVTTACLFASIGWCLSVVKFAKTDFKYPYKAEVIYGVGVVTGAGIVIGFLNIED